MDRAASARIAKQSPCNKVMWLTLFMKQNRTVEGVFFRRSYSFFKSPNLPKILQKTILNLKFKIPAHNSSLFWAGILNFKFRIVFGIFSFGDSEIWKKELNFLKKATFRQFYYCFVFKIFNFLKLQLCTGQNVHVMLCIALMVIAQYRTYIEWLCC